MLGRLIPRASEDFAGGSLSVHWTRSISSNQGALDQLSYLICRGSGQTPSCIFPYLELHHYSHWPYTEYVFDQLLQVDWPVFLKEVGCHERQRKWDCSSFKEVKEPLQLWCTVRPWTRGRCEGRSLGIWSGAVGMIVVGIQSFLNLITVLRLFLRKHWSTREQGML